MHSSLNKLCTDFEAALKRLQPTLASLTSGLRSSPNVLDGKKTAPMLEEIGKKLEVLAKTVAEQQSYVLIFGPLKSGKSTLMNAISASYVSEVSSLPAYPCMVYVSHSPRREFVLTRYDDDVVTLTKPGELVEHVSKWHGLLAQRIYEAEEEGEEFHPSKHCREAIRRIDVRLPAGELEQSGTVLVDTPGLYTRMKFGYDEMTREFREAAACAIFVVKSDNLFLEQVFDEFNELLNLFSRIFLIVNVDSTKQDLHPDGTLVPSLEQQDPSRLVEAFETLSMSAPLKTARTDGRLRIYPVDLLRAASQRLQGASKGKSPSKKDSAANHANGSVRASFDVFLEDLSEYLNSPEHLIAFFGDTLRRARHLTDRLDGFLKGAPVGALKKQVTSLEASLAKHQKGLEALSRLSEVDWRDAMRSLHTQLTTKVEEPLALAMEKTSRALQVAIDRWFRDDASLQDLFDKEFEPLLESFQDDFHLRVLSELQELITSTTAGLELTWETTQDLQTLEIELTSLSLDVYENLVSEVRYVDHDMPLLSDEITLNRSFWDVMLFRGNVAAARSFFGPATKPNVKRSSRIKADRVGRAGRAVMIRSIRIFAESFCSEVSQRLVDRFATEYAEALAKRLHAWVEEVSAHHREQVEAIESELPVLRRVQSPLLDLEREMGPSRKKIEELTARLKNTDPDSLSRAEPVA